jgi:hypothetical protein
MIRVREGVAEGYIKMTSRERVASGKVLSVRKGWTHEGGMQAEGNSLLALGGKQEIVSR